MSVPADKQIKSGFLNVPPASWIQTVLNKPWTRKQCVLYPASRQGVKRLEVFDLLPSLRRKEPAGLIIPLTDCLKVAEQRHKEHPFVFSVRTRDSSHVFETASVQELREWVDALQRIAFGDVPDTVQQRLSAPEHIASESVDFNDLYENVERRSVFPVVVEENETASALRLRGPHRLEVSASAVLLRDDDFTLRYTWLFKHIRRYGQTKGAFVLESGRSSETGAGTFVFRTRSAAQLHTQLQTAMAVLEKHHRASGGLATAALNPATVAGTRPNSPPPSVPLAEEPLQTQTLGRKSVKRAPKMSKPPRRSKPNSSGAGAARAAAATETTLSPLPNVVPLAEKQWLYTQSCDMTLSGASSSCSEPLYANDEVLDGAASAELVYAEPEERQAAWKQLARNTVEHTEHSASSSRRSSVVLGMELGEEMLRAVTSSGGARGSASYACLQHMAPRVGEPTTPGQYARLTPLTPTGGSTGGALTPMVAPSAAAADVSKDSAEAAAAAVTDDDENLYENCTSWDSAASSDGAQIYENVPSGKPGDVGKKPDDNPVRHIAINKMEYAIIDKPLLRQLNSGPF